MKIVDNKIDGIVFNETPNQGGAMEPDTIIIHYTAGDNTRGTVSWLCNPKAKASAHLVVGRDGEIFQLVLFNKKAWHAGKSQYTFPDGTKKNGFNKCSIGIEIVNSGELTKSGSKYVSWFGKEYQEEETYLGVHRNGKSAAYWHRYTEKQIQTVEEICSALIETYPNIEHILGHEEIAPQRKRDPGPAFPLDKLRARLLQTDPRSKEEDELPTALEGQILAPKLNIREKPNGSIIAPPLTQYTPVKILKQEGRWYEVITEIKGWVSADYVKIKKDG